jgi:adenylate cyclase
LPLGILGGIAIQSIAPREETFEGICLETDIRGSMDLTHRPHFNTEIKRYFRDVRSVVTRYSGVLIHAGDDSTMSYWRDSRRGSRTREAACRAAIELKRRFCSGAALDEGRYPTRIGMDAGPVRLLSGLSAGEAKVANVSGDVANTAARLQTLCKILGVWILASSGSVRGVKNVVFRPVGRFLLVGRNEPVDVVELLDLRRHMKPDALAARDEFIAAVELLAAGGQDAAKAAFARYIRHCPEDGAAKFLLAVLCDQTPNVARINSRGVVEVAVK